MSGGGGSAGGSRVGGTVVEHRVCGLAEVPVGEGRAYVVGGAQIAVFHLRDGAVRAVAAECPHAGGPLADGLIDTRVVVCPLHAHTFSLDSGACTTGAAPVRTYPARLDGDTVVITL